MKVSIICLLVAQTILANSFDFNRQDARVPEFLNALVVDHLGHNWVSDNNLREMRFQNAVTLRKTSIKVVRNFLEQFGNSLDYNVFLRGKTFVFLRKDNPHYNQYFIRDTVIQHSNLQEVKNDYYQLIRLHEDKYLLVYDKRYLKPLEFIESVQNQIKVSFELEENIVESDSSFDFGLFSEGLTFQIGIDNFTVTDLLENQKQQSVNHSINRKFQRTITELSQFEIDDYSVSVRNKTTNSDGVVTTEEIEAPVGFKLSMTEIKIDSLNFKAKLFIEDSRFVGKELRRFKTSIDLDQDLNTKRIAFHYTVKEKSEVETSLPFLNFWPFKKQSDKKIEKTIFYALKITKI